VTSPRPLTAETIAVGSELLLGNCTDTNSLFLADQLARAGIPLRYKTIVGDERDDIVEAVRIAAGRVGIVILTGGLGPTDDDCTRPAVARVTGRPLRHRAEASKILTARLTAWGRTPSPSHYKQAMIPAGAEVLDNPIGSAPGFALRWRRRLICALPGVPAEAERMFDTQVLPRLACMIPLAGRRSDPIPIRKLVLSTFGLPESDIDQRLSGLIPKGSPIRLGLLSSPLGVVTSLTGPSEAGGDHGGLLEDLFLEVRSRLADVVFAEGDQSMEEVVGHQLLQQRLTLAVAESCTGGLIGHRLTQVPGSSAYVDRAIVGYSNQAKSELLGVSPSLIARHGAVSREVAAAMAKGVRERSQVSVGLSVTGIAGPGGATAAKPVGLVYVGLDAGTAGRETKEFRFHGDRSTIKTRSSQGALDVLRRWLARRGQR
jgi:nicotinamide-nucleotide amidase